MDIPRRRRSATTRRLILRAAFAEFGRRGFQNADLDTIIARAGVTKGALYHHFQSKAGLGYAVIEESLQAWILDRWLAPIQEAENPLSALIDLARWGERSVTPEGLVFGSPLQTLAQELSAFDEGFRQRLAEIYKSWRDGLAVALADAQQDGQIRDDADPTAIATFLVAFWEGAIGLAKAEQRVETFTECRSMLEDYLATLRPAVS